MAFLVRKIEAPKWERCTPGPVSADAVTSSLRTQDNALSFWRVTDVAGLSDIALALVCKCDCIPTIDLVFLPEDDVLSRDFCVSQTAGDTILQHIRGQHRDISVPDLEKLGTFAALVQNAIQCKRCERFGKKRLKELLEKAITTGQVPPSQLRPRVRKDVDPTYAPQRPCHDCPF